MFKSSGTLTSIIVQDSVFLSHIIMSGRLCGIFLGSDTGLSHQISKSLHTVIAWFGVLKYLLRCIFVLVYNVFEYDFCYGVVADIQVEARRDSRAACSDVIQCFDILSA